MASAHALELALAENSSWKMSLFFAFLYLATLTQFSALLFAGAVGVDSWWRLGSDQISWRVRAVWAAGQAGALALLFFLYRTQIANLQHSLAAQNIHLLLANSYFHWGRDHLAAFIFARTLGVLQYAFGQLAVGDIAGALFVAGMVLLLRGTPEQQPPIGWLTYPLRKIHRNLHDGGDQYSVRGDVSARLERHAQPEQYARRATCVDISDGMGYGPGARELQERFAELHGLKADFFGRNISLFQLTVGPPVSEPAGKT